MIRFGLSAFLKLANLNPRPQRSAIHKRLLPSTGGYDFHRSLRRRASALLMESEPTGQIVASIAEISIPAERRSATAGLRQLIEWRRRFDGSTFEITNVRFESPNELFSITFDPICGIVIEDKRFAIHLWNTMRPDLDTRMVHATLQLFRQLNKPDFDEFAILSLRDGRLYRSDELRRDTPRADFFVGHFERLITDAGTTGTRLPGAEDRPSP